jgi:hypothetical protein
MSKPKLQKIVAPTNWKEDMHWYISVPDNQRQLYAEKYSSRTLVLHGQTCVVISYPRPNGFVALYDLDGGCIRWTEFKGLRGLPKGRPTEEMDFYYEAVLGSLLCDEASDIWFKLEV